MRSLRLLGLLLVATFLSGCVVAPGPSYGYATPYYSPPAVVYRPAPVYRSYYSRPYYGRPYAYGRPYGYGPRHGGWDRRW